MAALSPSASKAPPRPYRRFLTSALHRRFVHAATISLLVSLNNAFWLGSSKDLFWSWFPFGPAGIKALLFFLTSLLIFVLQIATLQVGRQTSTSPYATFRSNFLSLTAFQTAFFYLASGFWFTEVYIWSNPDLGWITRGTHNTPDVLNERPVFFRLYSFLLALGHAGIHLYRGHSLLRMPVAKLPTTSSPESAAQETHSLESIQVRLQRSLAPTVIQSLIVAGGTILVAPFINGLFLRNLFWQAHLALAKPFWNLSRANAHPIGFPPLGPTYLLRCFFAGFLLVLTWELTSTLFLTYLNQAPSKSGLPLSANSKDPNGTLLTGLKAKRDVVKSFAFWELATIAHKHKERRKAIFEDIERPTGAVWSQMVQAGLAVLLEIQVRITGPPPASKDQGAEEVKPLPRLVPEMHTESIIAREREPTTRGEWLASPLKAFGSTKKPWRPPIEETAKQMETKLLEYVKPPGADQTSAGLLDQWIAAVKQSPVGWFFTQTTSAKVNATVLGTPYGNAALVVDVIEALTKMQVASLTEDTYGKATPTVPDTVRTFTKTLNLIEAYVSQQKQDTTGGIEEVEIIIDRLRASLRELLAAFQVYLIDQGLGATELNQARKAIQPPSHSKDSGRASIEQPTERRMLNDRRPSDQGRQNQHRREEQPQKEEPFSSWSRPRKNSKGPLFQRREMEQVR
jgi:nucleoporin NDC1